MAVDATVPSLVLLTVLVAVVVAARLAPALRRHLRRPARPGAERTPAVVTARWCPRVVLIDDDGWTPAAA